MSDQQLDPGIRETPIGTTAERLAARGPIAVTGRASTMSVLSAEPFDIVIIGGGIAGAGVAREAALAGYRTALVERNDFACGTSSRSSRLVHGGVRYLEHGHFGLVFESSRERRLLLQLAPHLVRPLAFTWPVYKGSRVPRWKVRAGLTLYDVLSLFRNVQRHEGLSPEGVHGYEPALGMDGLRGGARYWDAATDDTRLTLATALAARDAGATVANHLDVIGGIRSNSGRLVGIDVRDNLTAQTFPIAARVVVNATGPWSDATAAITGETRNTQVFGSAGAHLAVPRRRIGNRDALTLVSPFDGRVMFVLPAGPHAIIGTTERPVRGGPDDVRATEQEVTYLLRTVNAFFPHAGLTPDDVVAAWAGIRPLAAARSGESNANAASREHAISHRDDGLVTVTGGKLTTFRAMAADVLKHATAEARRNGEGITAEGNVLPSDATPLPGGEMLSREQLLRDAAETVHDTAVGERLVHAYGSNWRNVWSYAQRDHSLGKRLVTDLPYLVAEVAHAVEREMACSLADVLIRRTHVAFETRDNARGVARRIAPLMGALLGWSEAERERKVGEFDAEVGGIFALDR
jgi:glycerol-3-phosphate dehydrogenase